MREFVIERTAASAALSSNERLVLWGMRAWMAGVKAEVAVTDALARTFADLGAEAAVPTLDSTMALLHAAGVNVFHHPWCRCLGDEERLLLDVLAQHQRGEDGAALFLTRLLLPPSGARLLGPGLHALAMALLACGVRLTGGRTRSMPGTGLAHWAPSTMTLQ
ncbi:hypothetical protein TSO221_29765 [Azospirillum sp. TSO22-1]|nr:hypothetical protein TSO221_29765 [Azospirillum sp. TSO22-1]